MFETFNTKSYFYLSNYQRVMVTVFLVLGFILSVFLIYAGKYILHDDDIKVLGIDIVKMTLTVTAVWIFLALYGSSNSKKRILREMHNFLSVDLPSMTRLRNDGLNGGGLKKLHSGYTLKPIIGISNSTIFEFSRANSRLSIHVYCRVTLEEVIIIFFLPAEFETNWEIIYQSCIEFLERSKIECEPTGKRRALWITDGVEDETAPAKFEVRFRRTLSAGFLFDAAARMDLSEKFFGDCVAFFECTDAELQKRTDPAALAFTQPCE